MTRDVAREILEAVAKDPSILKQDHRHPLDKYLGVGDGPPDLEQILRDTSNRGDCTQFYPSPREPYHVIVRRDDGTIEEPTLGEDFRWVMFLRTLHGSAP